MPFILRCRNIDDYPEEEWDLGEVLAKRRALMCYEPIISSLITRLDVWLIDRPDLTLEEIGQIWMRMMIVSSIQYELERDPDQKYSILLSMREHFEEFKKLPERWQENMRPAWTSLAQRTEPGGKRVGESKWQSAVSRALRQLYSRTCQRKSVLSASNLGHALPMRCTRARKSDDCLVASWKRSGAII